jgi:chromate transporter
MIEILLAYIKLYFIFFKVGLFTIGGGLAAIPLLQEEVLTRGWLTLAEFTDMIAVSESTPGPIGANVATYVGYSQYGILGSVVATIGLVSPSVIIIILIAKFVMHFRDHKIVDAVFVGLRPAVTGLILSAAYSVALISLVDVETFKVTSNILDLFQIKAIIMFIVFYYAVSKWKLHPIYYIVVAGVIGVLIF